MLQTLANALKTKEIRNRLIYTLVALVIVRFGCQLPIPGVDSTFVKNFFDQQGGIGSGVSFFDSMTGGSFSSMSIFALNITPYITSSIIIQLLTIAIPRLEELQKEGEDGRKKIAEYTRYITVALSLLESLGMVFAFGNQGYLKDGLTFTNIFVCVGALTAGAAFIMWIGERITEKGVGNGISIVLLINILSRFPNDMANLYNKFIANATVMNKLLAGAAIIVILIAMVAFIVVLQDAERRIPVQYAKKMQGRKTFGGQSSHIPLKVNTAGVIPVIFASSIMSFPIVIASFFGVRPQSGAGASLGQKILKILNQSDWCNFKDIYQFKYTIGLVIYIVLVIFFAYFYTSITFNPVEVSNNMKKAGGFIPGIRPGTPTTEYLTKVLNNIIFIGAIGLTIVAVTPIFFAGAFDADVSFSGTSLIIIVGVVLETIKKIESMMLVRHYKGFLSE